MILTAVKEAEARLAEVITSLDAASLLGSDALAAFDLLDCIEKLAAAGKALLAAQIEASDAWRGHRARDAIGFLADRSRQTRAQVRDSLAVAAGVAAAPLLDQSFRAGNLTVDQAADIAAVVQQHPEAEAELVALAPEVNRRSLKARCVEILAQGEGADAQHKRAKAERSTSSSVGRDGIWRQSTRLPVIDGAFIDKVLDHFQTQIFEAARKAGEREPFDAYRADALVAMAHAAMTGGASGSCGSKARSSSVRHAIVVTVPHSLFTGVGHQPGDICQVPGVGPVPASVVADLLAHDPIVKAVVTKGRDITAVATLTRTIKEDLRLAVLAVNDFSCGVPGCTNNRFLDLDHEQLFSKGGPTSYSNLRPLCSFHHDQRTAEGYELEGRPGSYRWIDPKGDPICADPGADPPDRCRGSSPPAVALA